MGTLLTESLTLSGDEETGKFPNHLGNFDEVRKMFLPPPPEIGEILSGESSLRKGQKIVSLASRWTRALGGGIVVAAVVFPVIWEWAMCTNPDARGLAYLCAVVIGVLASPLFFGEIHQCSYVGTKGVAIAPIHPGAPAKWKLFQFSEAAELRVEHIRKFVNGIYGGNFYTFKWVGTRGRQCFRLKGSYYHLRKKPKPEHPFHFANAAAMAWAYGGGKIRKGL